MSDDNSEIITELRNIARLLVLGPLEGGQRDKIEKLSAAGFSTGEIAHLIDTKSKIVSAELSNLKKRKRQRRK